MYPNWLQKQIVNPNVLSNQFVKISFSQNGEDDFVRSFFWDKILTQKTGYYLDIGCFHESLYSNTKLLNLVGWSGVAVDANPDSASLWMKQRPSDKFLNCAIRRSFESIQSVDFYRFQDGAINTTDFKIAKQWQQKGFNLKDRIKVPAMSLSELGMRIVQEWSTDFDFVNIDIEFVDYLDDLPEFLDLLKYPTLLCLEWISPNMSISNYKESREYKILSSQKYDIKAIIGGNIFAANKVMP